MSEFQNPQNQPGMEKRVMFIFAFTILLLLLAQQFLMKKQPQQPSPSAQQAAKSAPNTPAQPGQNTPPAPNAPVTTAEARQAQGETETVVENDVYRITFTNRGAQVKSWILKKYKDEAGHQLELVHQQAASKYGYPLSLWTWDQALKDKLSGALYVADKTGNVQAPQTLTFEFSDGDVTVKKTLSFDNSYVVKVNSSVQRGGSYVTALPAWPAGFGDATVAASYAAQRIDYTTNDELKRLKIDKSGKEISGGRVVAGNYQWAGPTDQYFAAIFLPENPQNSALAELRNSIEIPKDPDKPQGEKAHMDVLGSAVGSMNGPSNVRLFVGPKAVDILETVKSANGTDIRGTLDFGFFGFIGRPLFYALKWMQQHWIPNWGWAIIIATIIISIALLPLRISSMKSAMKMQRIQPHMQAIQEKYKKYKLDDPRRREMNTEMAALYKEHNVNPVGGCLPLIIQMPFLFAFYAMLANAIELRQAPWYWLHDLSARDPYYIMPILIVVTMIISQRMMPQSGMSKEQAQMMNVMTPLIFGFISWNYPSGMALYWVTTTVVSIIQQWAMNRTELGREMKTLAEKRARKQLEKQKR